MTFHGSSALWPRRLLAATAILTALALGLAAARQSEAQEVRLSGLFGGDRAPDTAAGYEVDPAWPLDSAQRDTDGAVSAIDIDPEGNIWVLRRAEPAVRVFDAKGQLVRSWSNVAFRRPHGLAFDPDGSVWVADAGAHVAQKFTRDGRLLLTLGTPGESGDDSAHFDQPTDVAVGRDGTIYVSDGYGNNRVARFDSAGRFLDSFGTEGSGPGQFRLPHALGVDSRGRLYVADRSNARVQVFAPDGRFLAQWRNLIVPWDIFISARDEILICGSTPMRWPKGVRLGVPLGVPPKDQVVMKFDPSGRVLELWSFAAGSSEAGALDWVHAVAAGRSGDLYLGDIEGRRVQKFRRLSADDATVDAAVRPARGGP